MIVPRHYENLGILHENTMLADPILSRHLIELTI